MQCMMGLKSDCLPAATDPLKTALSFPVEVDLSHPALAAHHWYTRHLQNTGDG